MIARIPIKISMNSIKTESVSYFFHFPNTFILIFRLFVIKKKFCGNLNFPVSLNIKYLKHLIISAITTRESCW